MKEFEIACALGSEPKLKEIQARAGGPQMRTVLIKRSIDSRKEPLWRYRYQAYSPDESYTPYSLPEYRDVHGAEGIVVIGAGPAGMFAALKLLVEGLRPIVLERGKDVHGRKYDMAALSRTGAVDPDSNYCYGEGGAGAFSDGKLFTRSSKRGDIREVLHTLVRFGASPEILYDAHPHIGSDRLPAVVENIRKEICLKGGEYHFGARVTKIRNTDGYEIETADGTVYRSRRVILATGHSARDIYEMLEAEGGQLEAKGFALGVRVEHPQEKINYAQYHGQWRPGLPPAEYSFVQQVDGRGVFSFCMCPGGILVPSSTEDGTVVLNGMSNSSRNGDLANAGVVVQIEPEDVPGEDPFRLMDFQHEVEKKMYDYCAGASLGKDEEASVSVTGPDGKKFRHPLAAPAQRMEDFCLGRVSKKMPRSSYFPGTISAPLHELLPGFVAKRLQKAFPQVKIKGYFTNAALLLGVESRTSSPIRIPRDPQSYEYVSMEGLYPCGEGAGYAGGIVSSALDGINAAAALSAALK